MIPALSIHTAHRIDIQPWGLDGRYIVVNAHGLLLTKRLEWTSQLTTESLYASRQEAADALKAFLANQ